MHGVKVVNTVMLLESELLELAGSYKVYEGHQKRNTIYAMHCPFHNDGVKSARYRLREGHFRCYACEVAFHCLDSWWRSRWSLCKETHKSVIRSAAWKLTERKNSYFTMCDLLV
ncbi:MAG: hypothetical protein F4039_01215 [Gammaproteobacteria bacterium]|nr:hypothetical protein [Gammaproteobacteria bacterium]